MVTKSWRILGNSRKQADLRGRRWGGGGWKGAAGRKVSSSFFFFNPSVISTIFFNTNT